jgi:biopolymer transport protein ExbD
MAGRVSSGVADDDEGLMSDINVTPMVDVILVLLIVFMITVPAIVGTAPVKVDLPESTAITAASEQLPLIFALKQSDTGEPVLYLNERQTDEAGVRKLFHENPPGPEQQVSLSADRGISYGRVMKVVDLLESLGLKKLSLDTKHVE